MAFVQTGVTRGAWKDNFEIWHREGDIDTFDTALYPELHILIQQGRWEAHGGRIEVPDAPPVQIVDAPGMGAPENFVAPETADTETIVTVQPDPFVDLPQKVSKGK